MLLWVDVESELPSKIEIRSNDPKSFIEFHFDQFVWNEPLDAQLFSLEIPAGYTTGTVVMKPLPARDKLAGKEKPKFVDGVLQYRVPSDLAWNADGTRITALLRIPETDQGRMGVPDELMQWDRESGECLWSYKINGANGMAGSADGKLLAVVVQFEIQIRDAKNGKIIRKFATKKFVSELAFSPDGKTLATGIAKWPQNGILGSKGEGGIEIWNVEQGTLVKTIIDGEKPTTYVAYLPDGKHVATYSGGGVKVWDVATEKIHRLFAGNECTAFSPDGELVACSHRVNQGEKSLAKIDIYRVADTSFVRSLNYDAEPASSWLTRLAFSPDSKSVAAADWNSTVTVWDVESGEIQQKISDHKAGVISLSFSPDGIMLATGAEDKTLRLHKLKAK
jgi:WD40 repeat protein